MSEFVRFPSTPYLLRPAGVELRDDKVFDDTERDAFLGHDLHVEEKLDGENLGISFDGTTLRFQARGSYVTPDARRFRGVPTWVAPRQYRLERALGTQLILFGEWCATTHTVYYDALPDWFLLFDVYDRSTGTFWPTPLRDEFAADLGLSVTPFVAVGRFTLQGLLDLIGPSAVGHEPMEGVVARVQTDAATTNRAKLVRPDFVQQIDDHWMTRTIQRNRLQPSS